MPDVPAVRTRRPPEMPLPRTEATATRVSGAGGTATGFPATPTDAVTGTDAVTRAAHDAVLAAGTVHGGLAAVAARHPDLNVAFPSIRVERTLGGLVDDASALAVALGGIGVRPGDNVGILSENSPDFLVALGGVNAAGAAACPLQLPASARDLAGYAARLERALTVAGIEVLLVGARTARLAGRFAPALGAVRLVTVSELLRPELLASDLMTPSSLPRVEPDDLALVQFTSGSTAAPKGVRLTHRNILAGLTAIIEGVELTGADHGGIWLPLFHDMGLFGTLSGIFVGMPMTIWSPADFVKDPGGWLRDFLGRGGSIAPMPNFAYDYLSDAVGPDEARELDLRGWRVAFNGAEPVDPRSIARFCDTFAPAGFSPATMLPVYGMAEATLAVTFPPRGREPVHLWVDRERLARDGVAHAVDPLDVEAGAAARGLVGVGRPVRGMRVRVGEPRGPGVLPENRVGEIQIRGEAVTTGYLTADPATPGADPFTADGWLRTGDLGFLRDGELYVTGRDKEMVIVRGENYYPQDAENAAHNVPGVYRQRCVAYAETSSSDGTAIASTDSTGIDTASTATASTTTASRAGAETAGAETMALLAETQLTETADLAALAEAIRAAVGAALGLAAVTVHLVPPNSLPRTSSGKFQRLTARAVCAPLALATAGSTD